MIDLAAEKAFADAIHVQNWHAARALCLQITRSFCGIRRLTSTQLAQQVCWMARLQFVRQMDERTAVSESDSCTDTCNGQNEACSVVGQEQPSASQNQPPTKPLQK